jgi:hypothetical protein
MTAKTVFSQPGRGLERNLFCLGKTKKRKNKKKKRKRNKERKFRAVICPYFISLKKDLRILRVLTRKAAFVNFISSCSFHQPEAKVKIITKFGSTEVSDESLQVLLAAANGFPIVLRCLGENGPPYLIEGYILMWNWETSRYHIYRSLDNALRACVHTRARYGSGDQRAGAQGERAQLSEIIQRHGMLWDMVADWRELSLAERRAFTAASLSTTATLRQARNCLRAGMAERATMAATLIDSLGRLNPPRTKALHATICKAARRRALDVGSINLRTDRRGSVLLEANEGNLDLLRRATAEAEGLACSSSENEIIPLIQRMKSLLAETHDIPFTHFFRRCLKDDLDPILTSIERGDSRDIARRKRRVRDAFEVFWFSRELAELRLRLAFALSRRPRRESELTALKSEFQFLNETMVTAQARGLDKRLRNSPLSRAIRHLSVALLEWGLGDFTALAIELDRAEETF